MNMISGSTGLSGAADSTFVLQKHSRLANIASLHCTGRDIPDRTLKLEFGEEDHIWKLLEDSKTCSGASKISTLQLVHLFSELLRADSTYLGSPSALSAKIDPDGQAWNHAEKGYPAGTGKRCGSKRKRDFSQRRTAATAKRWISLKRAESADLPHRGKNRPYRPCRACRTPAPRREARVAAVCGFLPRQRVCVRRGRKSPRCTDVRATRKSAGSEAAEKPRRGGKNPPVREEPASHLASRRSHRLPAKCLKSGRSPYPLHTKRRKDEKRQTIQHSNLSTRFGNDTPKSSTGAHEPERLCDRVLSRKTHRDS